MKHVIFKSGLFRRSNQNTEQGGELSFTKLLKRVLGYFNITFADPCCCEDDSAGPVRMTRTGGSANDLEYWDCTNDQWAAVNLNANLMDLHWIVTNNSGAPIDVDYYDDEWATQTVTIADGNSETIIGFALIDNPVTTDVTVTFMGYYD